MEQLFFYAFAIMAVISALCVVSVRSAVHSAFFLVICLLQVAAIFVLLRFPFLAAVQVFIYVGAVMVLFLFAVMMLDIGKETFGEKLHAQSVPAALVLIALFVVMGMLIYSGKLPATSVPFEEATPLLDTSAADFEAQRAKIRRLQDWLGRVKGEEGNV